MFTLPRAPAGLSSTVMVVYVKEFSLKKSMLNKRQGKKYDSLLSAFHQKNLPLL